LASRFAAGLAASGLGHSATLGVLRGDGGAALDAAGRLAAQAALVSGFHLAFLTCACFAAIGFLVTLPMRDLPLRA
jgi:hypothetical protein